MTINCTLIFVDRHLKQSPNASETGDGGRELSLSSVETELPTVDIPLDIVELERLLLISVAKSSVFAISAT